MAMRLARTSFAAALRKGLGRAFLHVSHCGLEGVKDLVLTACLENQSYDAQIESSRAGWLYRMFSGSPEYSAFRDAILGRLGTETETWNLLQLCGLANEMAARGDESARHRLWERVRDAASSPSNHDWVGAQIWIELQGLSGFVELAKIYGQRLLRDPSSFLPDSILPPESTSQWGEVLHGLADQEPRIKAYLDYLTARGELTPRQEPDVLEVARQKHHDRVRQSFSLEAILRNASDKYGRSPHSYSQFGRHATATELEAVFMRLLDEPDPAIRLRLLWVFDRAPIPRIDDALLQWADGPDDDLRRASIAALSQIAHDRVHDLARSKIQTSRLVGPDRGALDLFHRNYSGDDASLITQTLRSMQGSSEDVHWWGCSVVELSERYNDPALVNALRWIYETTPCANCRLRVIKELRELSQLDGEMLYECQYDAEEDIRRLASLITGVPDPIVRDRGAARKSASE